MPTMPYQDPTIFPQNPTYPAVQPLPQPPINYPSFLPDDPRAMATGLTPAMIAAINGSVPGAPPQQPMQQPQGAGGGMQIPQLQAPPAGSMRGQYQQAAQQYADKVNEMGSLDAYLNGRDYLAKLMSMGRFRRGGGSGGFVGGSSASGGGAGGNYGKSGR